MNIYQTKLYGDEYSKQDKNGFQFCVDEELTQYCLNEVVVENDPNTKLPPINYSVHRVFQWADFRCWILIHNETGTIVRESHNDFDLKMFIEAIKMSELGKMKEYEEREKNQSSWNV